MKNQISCSQLKDIFCWNKIIEIILYSMPGKLFLFLTFLVLSYANNDIYVNCRACGNNVCVTITGGPFSGNMIQTNSYRGCASYHFDCDSDCPEGCYLRVTSSNSFISCSKSTKLYQQSVTSTIFINLMAGGVVTTGALANPDFPQNWSLLLCPSALLIS